MGTRPDRCNVGFVVYYGISEVFQINNKMSIFSAITVTRIRVTARFGIDLDTKFSGAQDSCLNLRNVVRYCYSNWSKVKAKIPS
jgi:hypothetical protein